MDDHFSIPADDPVPPALRQRYEEHHIVPLWESKPAQTFGRPQEEARIWHWDTMLPIIMETSKIKAKHVLDRRVLHMTKPNRHHVFDEAITGQLTCTWQLVRPGERATPHRHAMNALRFVVQAGDGVKSIVNGKDCVMQKGDLILTPGGCWHEHVNEGDEPVIWLDVLDVGLHFLLETTWFQPGPARDVPPMAMDASFTRAGFSPLPDDADHAARPYSPIFRYGYGDAVRALEAAPVRADGARQIRYSNPLTGGPSMDLLDSTLLQLEPGQPTRPYSSAASTVCIVAEGRGVAEIGGKTIAFGPNDVFTHPARLFGSYRAEGGPARIFQVSNREVYRRLGLFSEAWGD